MSDNEKVTFGATIEPQERTAATLSAPQQLRPMPSNDSIPSEVPTPNLAQESNDIPDASNPFSAFYKHPDARRSLDKLTGPHSKTHLDVYEHDLETGHPISTTTSSAPKVSVDGRVKECTMWPSRQTMLEKAKANKRQRGCNLFRTLNSKQRLWAKIVIALFIVAAAVGLGVGISKAVGGGVWSSNGHSKQIPDSH